MDSRKRRTQAERTAETTLRILEAALDILEAEGMAAASTIAIAKKAKVSRGALLHHFPSKFNLIAAAVEHLLRTEGDSIEKASESVARGEITVNDFLDEMWERFSGRLFMITLDYIASARTDDELRAHLIPVSLAFNHRLDTIWNRFFVGTTLPGREAATALNLSLCLLRGMGVQTVLRPNDPHYFQNLLSTWKDVLPSLLRSDMAGKDR